MVEAATKEYISIIEINKNADEGFDLTMKWLNQTFVSAKNAIQYTDRNAHMITGKAEMLVSSSIAGYSLPLVFTISIELKDKKARFVFNVVNTYVTVNGQTSINNKIAQFTYDEFELKAKEIVISFANYVNSNTHEW